MFTISRNEKLTPEIITQMLTKYQTEVLPKLKTWHDYYEGKQKILFRSFPDETKPCNNTVTNFCKNIVDIYTGYIAAPNCISYKSDEDITQIQEVLKYNDVSAEDVALLKDALICGTGSEVMYVDYDKKIRFANVCPMSSFPIYSDDMTEDLLYFVRWTKENDWDFDNQNYFLDVYDNVNVYHYKMIGMNGPLEPLGSDRHMFNQCPANVFHLEDEKSIFDCIMNLQDAYNETLSNQTDEIEGMSNAYLALIGNFNREAFKEDLPDMKHNRILLLGENCDAKWVIKDTSETQVNTNLDRIQENIYRIACCPDFSSEKFINGVTSGIAIKYKLTGCETRAATVEAQMKKALQRRIELICGFASMITGEEVYRDISINFERNIPEDLTSVAQAVSTLKDVVSDETLMTLLPFVDDPKAEAEKVAKQREENESLYQKAFLSGEVTTDEEEE